MKTDRLVIRVMKTQTSIGIRVLLLSLKRSSAKSKRQSMKRHRKVKSWFSSVLCVIFSIKCFLVKSPQPILSPGVGIWKPQQQPPSPSSVSSGSLSPSRTLDLSGLSGSTSSFSSERMKIATHQWKSGIVVEEWNNEQVWPFTNCCLMTNTYILWFKLFKVCQWLMGIGIEHHINKFIEHGVEGNWNCYFF